MSEYEYLLQRLLVLEHSMHCVMATVMEMMPPSLSDNINRIGCEWDKQLDALDAKRDTHTAAQAATDKEESEA